MTLELREVVFGSEDYQRALLLRSRVLREPLGLRFSSEELAGESEDIHLGAFKTDTLVGNLILTPLNREVIKMRQVVVELNYQGMGIGKKLVGYSEEIAKKLGFKILKMNARQSAIPFYLALGYETDGEPFVEVGISHIKMEKRLI